MNFPKGVCDKRDHSSSYAGDHVGAVVLCPPVQVLRPRWTRLKTNSHRYIRKSDPYVLERMYSCEKRRNREQEFDYDYRAASLNVGFEGVFGGGPRKSSTNGEKSSSWKTASIRRNLFLDGVELADTASEKADKEGFENLSATFSLLRTSNFTLADPHPLPDANHPFVKRKLEKERAERLYRGKEVETKDAFLQEILADAVEEAADVESENNPGKKQRLELICKRAIGLLRQEADNLEGEHRMAEEEVAGEGSLEFVVLVMQLEFDVGEEGVFLLC